MWLMRSGKTFEALLLLLRNPNIYFLFMNISKFIRHLTVSYLIGSLYLEEEYVHLNYSYYLGSIHDISLMRDKIIFFEGVRFLN